MGMAMLAKPRALKMMQCVATSETRLSLTPTIAGRYLKSWPMRSLIPSFPQKRKKQSWLLAGAWTRSSATSTSLPDEPEEELPWHDEQQEEYK